MPRRPCSSALLWETCCHILAFQRKKRNGQKHHLGADTRPLSQSLPCARTWNVTGLNVSAGAKRMMPPQGDSLIRRLNYTVAPVQHDMSYLPPLPPLFRSLSLTPLINLQSDCPQDSLVLIRGGNMSKMHAPLYKRERTVLRSWQKGCCKV